MSPLQGLRVLDVGPTVAASFCTKVLGQLGADVVQVREPDVTGSASASAARAADPAAVVRDRAERAYLDGAKTIGDIDISSDAFCVELARADVVVRGLSPHERAASLRDEYDAWRAVRRDLVYVALTPFGTSGAAADWVGGDLHAQAMSGWVWANGNPGEPPLSVGYGVGEMQHGLHGAGAALAVLVNGEHDDGEFVDVNAALVTASTVRNYALVYRWNRIQLTRNGTRGPGSSGRYPHALFPCRDGAVTVMVRSVVEWQRLVEMIGSPAWASEPRYQDYRAMAIEYPEELDALIAPWIAQHSCDELVALALEWGVALAPLRSVDEVLDDEQLGFRGFFERIDVDGVEVIVPGLPAHFTSADADSR